MTDLITGTILGRSKMPSQDGEIQRRENLVNSILCLVDLDPLHPGVHTALLRRLTVARGDFPGTDYDYFYYCGHIIVV